MQWYCETFLQDCLSDPKVTFLFHIYLCTYNTTTTTNTTTNNKLWFYIKRCMLQIYIQYLCSLIMLL